MPYIGRNHIAGDHTSNFKVLDDISSYTATFNGSLATIISTADNTIRIPEHRFVQGQRVTYSNGGGGNIGGLTNGTAYFVTFDTANTFKLATSLANANNNTNINLSSVGTGSAHTLTAAFDGVNTTFKITHDGGSSANIVNSAQLQIAINNVIQKANLDSSYTEGFLVVDSRKIQFKTAPTADDIFWGNIIANTIDTFDIADLKIDQFTGDGVTTQFTLSRDVPNNQSVMVTLDGVVQHPSDKDTTRAYRILAEKVIEFSSPPGLNIEIQVRHLGFAGASTGDVTGFYGRTGNVVLGASDHITTGDITPRNINASGIVTASSFVGNLTGNVSGNLTVGGVLTYEDVTNVDSIGIITARSDIHVGAGVSAVGVGTFGSLDIGGDIDVDGHTNLDNVSIAGVATITAPNNTNGAFFINANNNANPFSIVTSKSSGGIGTYLFSNSSGRYDFKFENTYGGNWHTGSTFHTRILWTAPNESATTPEVCSIIPNTALAGAGGALWGLQFNVTDNVTGLKRAYEMSHNRHAFLLNGNVHGLEVNSTLGVGVTSYIYHGYSGGVGDTNTRFGFASNHNIVFDTDGIERLRINNSSSTFAHNIIASADLDVDGHTNLDNVSIAGITTMTGRLQIDSGDLKIFGTAPTLFLRDTNDNPDYRIMNSHGSYKIFDETNGVDRFIINPTGNVSILKDLDVDGHTNLDNVSIAGVVTATSFVGDGSNLTGLSGLSVANQADNRLITATGTTDALNGEAGLTYNTTELAVNGDITLDNGGSAGLNFKRGGVLKADIEIGSSSGELAIRAKDSSGFIKLTTGSSDVERLRIESWGGIHNNQSAIYGSGVSNEPVVHFNGAAPSSDAARGQFAFSDSAAYNQSPIARISLVTRYNSSGGYTFMGGIEGGKENTTDNNYDGFVRILTRKHGDSNIERLRIDSDGHVQLRQDDSEGSAQQKLQWISNNGDLSAQAAWGQGSANFDFSVFRSDSQTDYPYGNFRVLTGGTSPSESLKVTVGGQVLKSRNPAFRAQGNTHYPNQTSSIDLVYNNEIFDRGSNYNPSNGRFTAPVTGRYFFSYNFLTYPDNDNYWKTLGFKVNGTYQYNYGFEREQSNSQNSQQVFTFLELSANDYVQPHVEITSGTLDFYMTGGHAHFFGWLVS